MTIFLAIIGLIIAVELYYLAITEITDKIAKKRMDKAMAKFRRETYAHYNSMMDAI